MSLHFGYWALGTSPLRLSEMLDRMTVEVVSALDLDSHSLQGRQAACAVAGAGWVSRVLDLGAGRGRPARLAAGLLAGRTVVGVDVLVSHARIAIGEADAHSRSGSARPPRFACADLVAMPVRSGSFDAAFSIESLCHLNEDQIGLAIDEIARVLCPGARLALAEPFLRPVLATARLRSMRKRPLEGWSRQQLRVRPLLDVDRFCARLERAGLVEIERREVTWRLAPSALWLQWLLARRVFAARESASRAAALRLFLALVLASALGLRRRHGYYLIDASRR